MPETSANAKADLSRWIEEQTLLEYWFQQYYGLVEGIASRGECVVIQPADDMLILQLPAGDELVLRIDGPFIYEYSPHAANGFRVQARSLDRRLWILFKPRV